MNLKQWRLVLERIVYRGLSFLWPIESAACTAAPAFWLQGWFERLSRRQAYGVYWKALRECPAYGTFLADEKTSKRIPPSQWDTLPPMTKDRYVKRYSIESRCYGGIIPPRGTTIDESAGSSGAPNNWVRSRAERRQSIALMEQSFRLYYRKCRQPLLVLNCYAMGPWGTGILTTMALSNVSIVKPLGADIQKLENTLKIFGPHYQYIVMGYPPFVKRFLDTTTLDLGPYQIDLVVGGEAMSEGLRDTFLRRFKTVWSSYGASDIEIAMASETEFSIAARRWLRAQPALCERWFGQAAAPMLFQYNPVHYFIETSSEGELLFTMNGLFHAAPKIRYNLRDRGGTMRSAELKKLLAESGFPFARLTTTPSPYPVLWLCGRSDQTVAFYGAKVTPTDIDTVLDQHPALRERISSYQIAVEEKADLTPRLQIRLEQAPQRAMDQRPEMIRDLFYNGLIQCNQDFREISKLFARDQIEVSFFSHGSGPFGSNVNRIKNQYVGS